MQLVTIQRILKGLLNPITVLLMVATISIFYFYVDLDAAKIFSNWNLQTYITVLTWVTNAGDGLIVILFLMGGLYFRYINKHTIWELRFWFILQCIVLSGLICFILKMLFGRARPAQWFNVHEYGFYGLNINSAYWSFPSGHTTTILSIAFGLCVLFPRYWVLFVTPCFFVGLSRILLGYHYLSDVFVASYLTLLEVMTLTYFLYKKGWFAVPKLRNPSH